MSMNRLGMIGVVVVAGVLLSYVFRREVLALIVQPYRQTPMEVTGTIQEHLLQDETFDELPYFLYLPAGYNASEQQRFRVLYHLHGAMLPPGQARLECQFIGSQLDVAVTENKIDPMIVVCPADVEGNRMWADSYDGKHQVARLVTEALVTHIDATYRTQAQPLGRILQGFSMGGFGAVVNGFRNPEVFGKVLVWDGALHEWDTISTSRRVISNKMFASQDYFENWSPSAVTQQTTQPLFMVVSQMNATRTMGARFQQHLDEIDLPYTYFDSTCGHNFECLFNEFADAAYLFMGRG